MPDLPNIDEQDRIEIESAHTVSQSARPPAEIFRSTEHRYHEPFLFLSQLLLEMVCVRSRIPRH